MLANSRREGAWRQGRLFFLRQREARWASSDSPALCPEISVVPLGVFSLAAPAKVRAGAGLARFVPGSGTGGGRGNRGRDGAEVQLVAHAGLKGNGHTLQLYDELKIRRGRPGLSDLSPCVTGRQWFEQHLTGDLDTAGWRSLFSPLRLLRSLKSEWCGQTTLSDVHPMLWNRSQALPSTSCYELMPFRRSRPYGSSVPP